MGFFDADGDLIALWAGTDIEPRQVGAVDYSLRHILNFSRVEDGIVTVDVTSNEFYDWQLSVLRELADARLEQFKQSEAIRAHHGAY
jgi:hypothetical protein